MSNILYCLYNYLGLFINVGYIYVLKIDINSNEYWINKLKNNIESCGCMSIKCIQWILPRYQLLYPDTKLSKKFSLFYEHCHVHSIEHTEIMFMKSFNISIYDRFNIIKLIGSGSIGQVYLIEDINTEKQYALKINHPNIKNEYYIFNFFIKSILCIIDYKKFIPINDINEFIISMKNQIDLRNEYNYNEIIYDIYKDNDFIVIPKIYINKSNILIMDYIDGNEFNIDTIGEYNSYKILTLLSIFTNNNCLYNISHGDLHKGNWKVIYDEEIKEYKIVIYDYGFCFNIDSDEYKTIDTIVKTDDKLSTMELFVNYYSNKEYNKNLDKGILRIEYNKLINKYKHNNSIKLGPFINILLEYCIDNNLLITSTCINGFLMYLQLSSFYDKVDITSKHSTHTSYLLQVSTYCKANNICPLLIDYMDEQIKKNDYKCSMLKDFSKFEGLKKFM